VGGVAWKGGRLVFWKQFSKGRELVAEKGGGGVLLGVSGVLTCPPVKKAYRNPTRQGEEEDSPFFELTSEKIEGRGPSLGNGEGGGIIH